MSLIDANLRGDLQIQINMPKNSYSASDIKWK